MDKGSNQRDGKIVSGGHSTRVEGLNKFLQTLEQWPEITSIRLGHIERKNSVGRKSKKLKISGFSESNPTQDIPIESVVHPTQAHKRAKGGGGFSFKATRPAMVGTRMTGIQCQASHGTIVQLLVLSGDDLDVLKSRLQAEGFGANW